MERHHEEELKKLKADHDQLEARMKRPQGEECSSHTMPECTQGESYPQHTCFSSQYTTNRSHCMTSTTLVSLRLVYDESLGKFMDKFGRIGVHTQNLNQEVALHSMLHALWPTKFADNQCKRPHSSMDELCERAK
ncbi:hypothetical protein JHK86_015940 [Glycine max]|nr:hypothetical protein JHK86_015940 [Glycine max]